MGEAKKPRLRNAQRIPAGLVPSPRWLTARPDPLAFQDEIRLTKDERVTLIFISRGCTLREIQGRMGCAYREAQRHRTSVHRKLGARTDAHAVFLALEKGELRT